eukprot:5806610-Amphidinium_carterae.1
MDQKPEIRMNTKRSTLPAEVAKQLFNPQLGSVLVAAENLQLNAPAEVRLGQDIGAAILEGQDAGDMMQRGSPTVLVNDALVNVSMQLNTDGSGSRSSYDLCERNWELPCPDGWNQDALEAFDSSSACAALQPAFATVDEKQMFAAECKAPWPCLSLPCQSHKLADCPAGGFTEHGHQPFEL